MTNLITIELSTEDRARLDRLIAALENKTTQAETPADPVTEALAEVLDNVTEPTVVETSTEETPKEETKITADLIQQKVMELCKANGGKHKGTVKDIVTAYAPTVSKIPEDKWSEVWDKLIALEAEV